MKNGLMKFNVYVPQMLVTLKILCKCVFRRLKIITDLEKTENKFFYCFEIKVWRNADKQMIN